MELNHIARVVVDTTDGSYGFLPKRLDCVAALVPGILTYEKTNAELFYIAIDEGLLIKTEDRIQISVRNAIAGKDLGKLHEAIEKEFKSINEEERKTRAAVGKLESVIVQNIQKLHQE